MSVCHGKLPIVQSACIVVQVFTNGSYALLCMCLTCTDSCLPSGCVGSDVLCRVFVFVLLNIIGLSVGLISSWNFG
jgi:hypothetical protein